jgi:hypothetical protein
MQMQRQRTPLELIQRLSNSMNMLNLAWRRGNMENLTVKRLEDMNLWATGVQMVTFKLLELERRSTDDAEGAPGVGVPPKP